MKIAIVTDSNSGITQLQAKRLGVYVIPMPFMIQEENFEEDINLSQEEFYERLGDGMDISTSQPSPDTVMRLWDELLNEYDEVVHIPMSSGLSSACQTALLLSEEYDGRVQVVDNKRISVTQRQSVLDAQELAGKGKTAAEIKAILERTALDASIYITVDTLKYLKKGGRITPAAAALGTLLRIKPVLQIQGDKLDAFAKARTMKQAKTVMLTALAHDLEQRFADPQAKRTHLFIAHTYNETAAGELLAEVKALYPEAVVYADPLSLSVACHIGPGSLAVACSGKLEVE